MHPAPDDPDLAQRPSPSRSFKIPMDSVGDFLMVWDFCCSFGKLLQLSPFSLDDFENALCCKESYVVLIVETHAALFNLLINDDEEFLSAIQRNKRKPKVEHFKKFQIFSPSLIHVYYKKLLKDISFSLMTNTPLKKLYRLPAYILAFNFC